MKIEKLTHEQETKITEYRDRYFRQATSTEPADRRRAEAAARKLGEIIDAGLKNVYWVDTPAMGAVMSTRRCGGKFRETAVTRLRDIPGWWRCLQGSIGGGVMSLLRGALQDVTQSALGGYCGGPACDDLLDSTFDNLWDSGHLSLCSYVSDVLGVVYDESRSAELHAYGEIASSCFALWMTYDEAILCERPQSVKIIDGRLVGLEWRNTNEDRIF